MNVLAPLDHHSPKRAWRRGAAAFTLVALALTGCSGSKDTKDGTNPFSAATAEGMGPGRQHNPGQGNEGDRQPQQSLPTPNSNGPNPFNPSAGPGAPGGASPRTKPGQRVCPGFWWDRRQVIGNPVVDEQNRPLSVQTKNQTDITFGGPIKPAGEVQWYDREGLSVDRPSCGPVALKGVVVTQPNGRKTHEWTYQPYQKPAVSGPLDAAHIARWGIVSWDTGPLSTNEAFDVINNATRVIQ